MMRRSVPNVVWLAWIIVAAGACGGPPEPKATSSPAASPPTVAGPDAARDIAVERFDCQFQFGGEESRGTTLLCRLDLHNTSAHYEYREITYRLQLDHAGSRVSTRVLDLDLEPGERWRGLLRLEGADSLSTYQRFEIDRAVVVKKRWRVHGNS